MYNEVSLLFNSDEDTGEKHNISVNHPEIVKEINHMVEEHKLNMILIKDQLAKRITIKSNTESTKTN